MFSEIKALKTIIIYKRKERGYWKKCIIYGGKQKYL